MNSSKPQFLLVLVTLALTVLLVPASGYAALEGKWSGPVQRWDSTEEELTALIQELNRESSEARARARSRLDARSDRASLDTYFAIQAFGMSVDLFWDLWRQKDRRLLAGATKQLLDQFAAADSTLRRDRLPDERIRQIWVRLRSRTGELATLYDEFLRGSATQSAVGRLRWNGRIDGSTSVLLIGNNVTAHLLEGAAARDTSFNLSSSLPREAVIVELQQLRGRGTVTVLERPSRWNDYRVVLLIEDDQPGSDHYEFELTWRR